MWLFGGKGRNLSEDMQYQYKGNTHLIDRPLGVINYFLTHENGFSYPWKWIFSRMKMDFLPYENGFSSDWNYISAYLWCRALLDLLWRLDEETDFLPRELRFSREQTANSSELRNLSSEVSFHSSELLFQTSEEISILHGAIWKFLRGNWLLAGVKRHFSSHILSKLYKVSLPSSYSGLA